MAAVALNSKAVGSTVKLKVDGVLRDFIIVHKGRPSTLYDSSCDGVWLLLKDMLETRQWHASNVNDYANSDLHKYLNNTWIKKLDANIQAQVKQVKIPYRPGSGTSKSVNSGANGLSCKVFLLSGYEMGWTSSDNQYFPVDGAKLSYFDAGTGTTANNKRIANYNGSATGWWLRSPSTSYATYAWNVGSNGNYGHSNCSSTYGVRPALILPSSLLVSDDGSVNTNTAPTTPGNITVPDSIQGGETITVSWAASSDAESNLEGYIVERSTDGGASWAQIYQGSSRSTTNTVPFGTGTVQYRVKAYDTDGASSAYRTSAAITVINNLAPGAPASITVPNTVMGGGNLAITWGAATDSDGDLAGYSLERQVDGGEWTQIYSGTALSFTDSITKGWASVAYRVRAYDSHSAYGDYSTSETRTVNNNTPPAIVCTTTGDLGTKSAGFTIPYQVSDADSDPITVSETIDGILKRSFTADPAVSNSFAVTGEYFMKLANGQHTLKITASDGKEASTHEITFTKEVTAASISLDEPMEADAKITVCVLSVTGDIPTDAEYKVEVTNNANDETPVWEECTTEVKNGANHVFTNETAASGFAFNFRVTVERGESGKGGYITSIQGGFQ